VIHIPHTLLFKIFLYINMADIDDAKGEANDAIRALMQDANIPSNDIDDMLNSFDEHVTTLVTDEVTSSNTQSYDFQSLINEFSDIISNHTNLLASNDYDNIHVTIDNTDRIIDIYRQMYEQNYNRIKELSETRKDENKDLNKNIGNTEKLVNTNKRKAVYEKRQFEGLKIYRLVLLITFYVLLIVYLLFGNFRTSRLYRNRPFLYIFLPLIIFPLIVKYVVRFIYQISNKVSHFLNNEAPKNVYVDI